MASAPRSLTEPDRVPSGVDYSKPNVARMYDYYLGGKDNFAVDRQAAEAAIAASPVAAIMARENRAFLGRAVRHAVSSGIRQFIDLGTGLPTMGNVHEVAQEVDPTVRVVYVDYDPVVVAHGRALLAQQDRTAVIEADLREPEGILEHPVLHRFIDFGEPVAILMVAVMHFVTEDDDPNGIVAQFRDLMAPGSQLVMSHASDILPEALRLVEAYRNARATAPVVLRTPDQIRRLFDGFELLEPGLVPLPQWHPDVPPTEPNRIWILAGVGRKP